MCICSILTVNQVPYHTHALNVCCNVFNHLFISMRGSKKGCPTPTQPQTPLPPEKFQLLKVSKHSKIAKNRPWTLPSPANKIILWTPFP